MDDARIRQLTQEVLAQIGGTAAGSSSPGLEERVSALEAVVARLQPPPVPTASSGPAHVHVHAHPSLQALRVGPASSDRCVMEPDKPCVQSHACKTFGH
jgi:hypothetical protein